MLKFLDDRPEDRSPKKSPIKYQPEMCYGNSYESPTQFQTPHTIYHKPSYVNPFLPFQKRRAQLIAKERKINIQPLWTQKTNNSMIEEHKILAEPEADPPQSRYLRSFYKQFDENPKRFNITRGQFTNFIQKNNHYRPMGPMQGIQRSQERINSRHKSVWIKPPSKRDQMTSSLKFASGLETTIKSSICENSEKLLEKIRIRRNRQTVRNTFWKGLENRKKLGTSARFELPKKGADHQLCLVDDGFQARYCSSSPSKQGQNLQDELKKFEGKLNRILK